MSSVRARAICSATESEEKVARAVSNVLSIDVSGRAKWLRTTGIFNEPLSVLEVEVTGDDAVAVADRILSVLTEDEMEERTERAGEGEVIHLRFDKQEAYRGRLVLGERDAVKVEVRRVRA